MCYVSIILTYCFIKGFGQATYFSAICVAAVGLPRVQVQINKNNQLAGVENELKLIVNGTEKDIGSLEQDAETTKALDGVSSSIQFKRTNSSLTIIFSSGLSVTTSVAYVSKHLFL